jgi:hypothetical protein
MTILQLRRYQPRDADLTAVAASGVAAAWTAYTPTVTAGSGAFTTVSGAGRYLVIGKTTLISVTVTITTNGTAAGYVHVTLPNTPQGSVQLTGRESAAGKALQTRAGGGSTFDILNYDGTYPGASGGVLVVGGVYENT